MQGCLEWFEDIKYEYNCFNRMLIAKKYNPFLQKDEILGQNQIGQTEIRYPEGVRVALGFVIHNEACKFHENCRRFELKGVNNRVLSIICRKVYRLNIKLV